MFVFLATNDVGGKTGTKNVKKGLKNVTLKAERR